MPMPSLNELLNVVNSVGSQNYGNIYQQARSSETDRYFKEQQAAKVIQEMKMAEAMQPYEIESKQASTRLNNASAAKGEQEHAFTQRLHNDKDYFDAQADQQGYANELAAAQATNARADAYKTSQETNKAVKYNWFLNAWGNATPAEREKLAFEWPDMFLEMKKMENDLLRTKLAANASIAAAAASVKPDVNRQTITGMEIGPNGLPIKREQQVTNYGEAASQIGTPTTQQSLDPALIAAARARGIIK